MTHSAKNNPRRRSAGKTLGLWALIFACIAGLTFAFSQLVQWQRTIKDAQIAQTSFFQKYNFDPGYIISDQQFFDSNSMTAAEVQTFLEQKGAGCSGSRCLKTMKFTVRSQPQDAQCKRYTAPKDKKASAAQIIDASARACGISQKVLLTLLQKEQHLVQANDVTKTQLNSAMGLSCPDDASCDKKYQGFFNQVFGAAKRFKYYLNHEKEYSYHAGTLNYVRYSPNAQCGGKNVYIYNSATAILYIYTPYQPNAAALKAGTAAGDACSSYGNRNFSIIYNDFFGSPTRSQ